MDLDSSAEDVAKLEGRTEGWIAGLQLAALSMRGREDASGFVETFSGSNRDVLDFLAEEVLEIQPEAVRGFLLATSVLERLSAPLCDTLTGNNDGDEMLKRLERENALCRRFGRRAEVVPLPSPLRRVPARPPRA